MTIRAAQHLKNEIADAKAYSDTSLSWAGRKRWYAIRTAPGSQRSPSITGDLPHQRGKDGCSIIERNLRNEGIDVFMPCVRRDVIHHRTRKWIDKCFPLLVGYAFVNLPKGNFGQFEEVDGVSGFVRPGNSRFCEPLVFPEGLIGKLRFTEFELEQQFLQQRLYRQRRQELWAQMDQQRPSRAEMRKLFPRGSRLVLRPSSPVARFPVNVLSVSAAGTIRAAVETLDKMVNVDIPLEHIADVE